MPRKTLFKPEKAINLSKDPLWKEVFIDNATKDEEDSGSDSDDELMLKMYKLAAAEAGVKLNVRNIMNQKKRNVESAKVELFNRVENPDTILPKVKYPSLHPKERPFESYLDEIQFDKFIRRREKDLAKRRLNTAEENYKSVAKDFPASKDMMNIKMADTELPDPSFSKELHSAARTFQNTSPM